MTTTLEETATGALAAPRAATPGAPDVRALRRLRSIPWPICMITAIAAALRFAQIEGVAGNEFYDAAVRSMSTSWHNFFFGSFDPAGLLSIDKPPLDLWLQVTSVKLLGWSQFALKLPEALGGTLAAPLLYDAVRRAAGRPAGLAAALALAVLPESVLSSRSDTMDSMMMLLVIAALWLTIRACTGGERRALVLAGVALGLAFNVKLMESFVAVPALVVLFLLAAPGAIRRKLVDLALAGAALRGLATRTTVYSWSGCTGNVAVEHIKISGGRHQWPGATPADPGPPSTICGACTVWRFFSGLRSGRRSWSRSGGAGFPGPA